MARFTFNDYPAVISEVDFKNLYLVYSRNTSQTIDGFTDDGFEFYNQVTEALYNYGYQYIIVFYDVLNSRFSAKLLKSQINIETYVNMIKSPYIDVFTLNCTHLEKMDSFRSPDMEGISEIMVYMNNYSQIGITVSDLNSEMFVPYFLY